MGQIHVHYKAGSLEDLADGILQRAQEKREQASTSTTQRTQCDLVHEALGLEEASDIVRATTIDPNMDDE